jgi:Ca-activated chloride channel homolog
MGRVLNFRYYVLLSCLLVGGLSWHVQAQEQAQEQVQERRAGQRVMLVLDGSGSMWGQIDGQNKIVIARQVIADLMSNWDAATQIGLTAYGHRLKGDCRDIETLVPVGTGNTAAITKFVQGISPTGKTPLSAAVAHAADAMNYEVEPTTIILVTDGLETCAADPCAVATSLEQAGVDFTTHVIGFDVTEEESAKLRCLADNTGGRYYTADSAIDLTEAMAEVVAVLPAGGDYFRVVLSDQSPPVEQGSIGFAFYPVSSKDETIGQVYGPHPQYPLSPGIYRVDAHWEDAAASAKIEVQANNQQTHVVTLNAGTVGLTTQLDEGVLAGASNASWRAFAVGADGVVAREAMAYSAGSAAFFVLPAGRYQLSARSGDASASIEHLVVAGEQVEKSIDLRAGQVTLDVVLAEGMALGEMRASWRLYALGSMGVRAKKTTAYQSGRQAVFTVAAGKYELEVRSGATRRSFNIEVVAGDVSSRTFVLDAGWLNGQVVAANGTPSTLRYGWRVYPIEGGARGKSLDYQSGATATFLLPVGLYDLEARGHDQKLTHRVNVAAGGTIDINLQ